MDEGYGIYIFIKHYMFPVSLIIYDMGPQSGGGGGGSPDFVDDVAMLINEVSLDTQGSS